MKLADLFEMDIDLARALGKVTGYGQSLNQSAEKRNRQMLKIGRKSKDFRTIAMDMVNMYEGMSLAEFIDEMKVYFPYGEPNVHYFKWKDAFKRALKDAKDAKKEKRYVA
jgi:hypothetical protein